MTLIDIMDEWLTEKWPNTLYIERNVKDHLHVFSRKAYDQGPSAFILKVEDNFVDLADHRLESRCICCSSKRRIKASDPEFFAQIETEINAWHKFS